MFALVPNPLQNPTECQHRGARIIISLFAHLPNGGRRLLGIKPFVLIRKDSLQWRIKVEECVCRTRIEDRGQLSVGQTIHKTLQSLLFPFARALVGDFEQRNPEYVYGLIIWEVFRALNFLPNFGDGCHSVAPQMTWF